MRLADRFYLAAHHDVTGKPRAHHRAIAYGLSAALLVEVLYDGRITVNQGEVRVVDPTLVADPLADTVLHQMTIEPQHTAVGVWLAFVAQDAREQVARRLHRRGVVRRAQARRMLRRAVTYVPADMNAAAWCWIDLLTKVRHGAPLAPCDVALAGLLVTTGLDLHLFDGEPAPIRDHLRAVTAAAWPPLRELLVHTGIAIAGGTLTART